MIASPLPSPSPVADPLAGLLVALDLRGIVLFLDANGQPRAKLPLGMALDAETRALLGANRAAIVEHLHEQELWRLGRLAQGGCAQAMVGFHALLKTYEEVA